MTHPGTRTTRSRMRQECSGICVYRYQSEQASYIYIVSSVGHAGLGRYGRTLVYRLDTQSFRIEEMEVLGEAPEWTSRHKATVVSDHEICISVGMVLIGDGLQERSVGTRSLRWARRS
ncbi:uncharacterized protein K441DRAFT_344270 [Cenococcum geophilum 1.58]|uniref:uncharacterized protein n=1 Tax=Cenococcum geophilum 1.58 TaxID=794803 RepID=UPI00358F5EB4|nr:hypothetical protein K441DRAFT_344270 [Cenococcum geophilum 1.58]